MPTAVVEDWDQFKAFLSGQPLCMWSAQKKQELVTGTHGDRGGPLQPSPKNDNADLLAALSSMA